MDSYPENPKEDFIIIGHSAKTGTEDSVVIGTKAISYIPQEFLDFLNKKQPKEKQMDSYHDIKKKWQEVMRSDTTIPLAVAFNDISYLIDLLEVSDKKLMLAQKCITEMTSCIDRMERLSL